jgi:methanethiol S-methyltransferase
MHPQADTKMMAHVLIVSLTTTIYGVLHSLLASATAKDWIRGRFGPSTDRLYRLGYNAIAVITFLPVLAALVARPGEILYQLGSPWNAAAIAGQLLCLVVVGLGLLQSDAWSFLGLRQLAGTARAPSHLVATGLYRWVRHPLYTAGLAFIWLMSVMTTSLLAVNIVLTVYILIGSRLEERRLVAEFGKAYEEYQRQVPSLLPLRIPPPR